MGRIFECEVVKTHQPRHVDHPVVHLPPLLAPRHRRHQRIEQFVGIAQPAGADLDEGAIPKLSALGVLEQGALYCHLHGAQFIAHPFDRRARGGVWVGPIAPGAANVKPWLLSWAPIPRWARCGWSSCTAPAGSCGGSTRANSTSCFSMGCHGSPARKKSTISSPNC